MCLFNTAEPPARPRKVVPAIPHPPADGLRKIFETNVREQHGLSETRREDARMTSSFHTIFKTTGKSWSPIDSPAD
jgi:hypothetical protein